MKQPYRKDELVESAIDLILKGKKFYFCRDTDAHMNPFATITYYDGGMAFTLFIYGSKDAVHSKPVNGKEIPGRMVLALINKHWDERIAEDKWDLWHAKIMAEASL